MTSSSRMWSVVMTAVVVVFSVVALSAQANRGKEHVFHGKVEKVDAKSKTMVVNGENVEGWMAAMTMTYAIDNADALEKVKAGDQITAKVYDGDQRTLYDVQVAAPKGR